MRAFLAAAALAVVVPTLASAAPVTSLTLADATKAPSGRVIVDGAAWRCEGETCTATGGSSQPAARACRRVVAKMGQVTAFTYRGETLDAAALAVCNAA